MLSKKKATTTKKKVTLTKKSAKKNESNDIGSLKDLKNYVALAVVDAKKYQKTNIGIIKTFLDQGIPGVYVTLNRPFENIKELFEIQKIDTKNVIFIDAVTKTAGGVIKKQKDCLFIGGPKNLSDISIAMDQGIMAIPGKDKFLFFDSLNTLLMYNDVRVVAKFVHFLSTKMRVWKVKGIIISLRRTQDSDLINELHALCDVKLDL